MKNRVFAPTFLFILAACAAIAVLGQRESPAPFDEMDKVVRSQGGWAFNTESLAKLFNIERKRLGDQFEQELMKYLGQDLEKHYWISTYLEAEYYLRGATPLPQLSLLIKHQSLALLEWKEDFASLSNVMRFSVSAALLSERLGFYQLAVSHKMRAERLVLKNADLKTSIPAITEEEHQLYEALPISYTEPDGKRLQLAKKADEAVRTGRPSQPSGVKPPAVPTPTPTPAPSPKTIQVTSELLKSKAIKKVQPSYPPEAKKARVSGTVKIQVLVSEEGRLIEATFIEGPVPLREASLDAARRWEFKPTMLNDLLVKVSGILTFSF